MTIRLDSPIYRGLTRVFDAALITVYWAVCSLPVVTAGAAASAMFAAMMTVAGGDTGVTARFFRTFRDNFKLATLDFLVYAALGALLALDVGICWFQEGLTGPMWQVFRGVTLAAAVLFFILGTYLFAGISAFQVRFLQSWRNALVLTLRHPMASLGLLLLTAGMILACAFLLIFALPLLAVGFYCQAVQLRRIFEAEAKDAGLIREEEA